jgi:methyl-accepting chemotaxis protein
MFQSIISSGLTDTVKAVVTVAGGFFIIYIKHHIDLTKIKKAEAFVQSKPALEKLVQDVKNAAEEVLTSPETVDKSSSIIAAFAQKQGFKVTKEQVAQLIATGESAADADVKEVAQEVQQTVPGSNAVQSPTAHK